MFWLAALAGVAFIYLFGGSALASLGGNLMLLKFAATLAAAAMAQADNRTLGQFELSGIAPAPRGMPQ